MTDTTDDAPRHRRRRFTDASLDNWTEFRPGPKRKLVPHPEKIGHYVIVQKARATGAAVRSFAVQARDGITGRQVWHTVGRCDRLSVVDAARQGDEIIGRIRKGLPPVDPPKPPPATLQALSADWLAQYVVKKGLRTRREIERKLNVYILSRIGERIFEELQRSDIAKLLDTVADDNGERMADAVYTVLMSIAHWHAGRSNYVVAYDNIPKHSEAPARDRVLNHAELREIWRLASESDAGVFGAIVRLALLTGQRRDKIVGMRHGDIVNGFVVSEVRDRVVREVTYDGVWRIPREDREKGNGEELLLPQAALDIVAGRPSMPSWPQATRASRRIGYTICAALHAPCCPRSASAATPPSGCSVTGSAAGSRESTTASNSFGRRARRWRRSPSTSRSSSPARCRAGDRHELGTAPAGHGRARAGLEHPGTERRMGGLPARGRRHRWQVP